MRVINKGLATKVFAGVLSVIPMTQTGAQKAASLTTRNARSSHLLASANVNLSAVARDTYDASEKFVTKSKKGVSHSKVATGHKTTHAAAPLVDMNQRLANYGSRLIKTTEESQIYDVPVQSVNKLKVLAFEIMPERIEDIKIAVPKQNSKVKISDCPVVLTLKKQLKPVETFQAEIKTKILIKGANDVAYVEDKEIPLDNGAIAYYKSYYRTERIGHSEKYKRVGFSQTHVVMENGQQSIDYNVIGKMPGNPAVEEAQFDINREDIAGRFGDLLFDEPGASENQSEAVSSRIKSAKRLLKANSPAKTVQKRTQSPNTMSSAEVMMILQEQARRAQQQLQQQNDMFRDADTQKWKYYYEHKSVTVPHYGY